MRKALVLLVALALLLGAAPAMGEGALSVVQENFHVVGSSSFYGYLYLKLQNTGDAPIRVDGGSLEISDAEGNVLATSTTLWRFAEYLKPGETTYAYFTQRIDGIESADAALTYARDIAFRENSEKEALRLPVESMFEDDITEGYWTHDYMTTTVVNDTNQTVFDVAIVRALLDADGNILYIDSDNMYNYKGITAGSAIVLRRTLNSNFESYFTERGLVPDAVDAIAYANVADAGLFTRGEEPEPDNADTEEKPAADGEAAYATLRKGDKGGGVQALQQRLKELGYLSGKVDGDYGKGTAAAVSAFQAKAGLAETGVADAVTQSALYADDAPAA